MKVSIKKQEDVKKFANIFKHIGSLQEFFKLNFTPNGVSGQAMDAAHVCLFELNLASQWFGEYEVETEINVGVASILFCKMIEDTFEQYAANEIALADSKKWIKEQDVCMVMLWTGSPLMVTAPNFVELKVSSTDPGLKGATAQGGVKPATLETGVTVRVPLFIEQEEVIKVDTRTGEYVSRAK